VRRVVFLSILVGLSARGASAGLAFPSVVERVIGTRIDLMPVREALSDSTARIRAEVADHELYGIDGLRTNGARVSGSAHAWFVTATLTGVSAPVGAQTRLILEAGYALRRLWQSSARAGAERLSLDGVPARTWRVAGVASRIDMGRVATIADIEIIDGDGAGYETSLTLSMRARAGAAQVIGVVRVDGDRFVGAGVALAVRVGRTLTLMAGYDDGSASMRFAVVIDWRGVEIATGVSQHPVLGMSQGMSVACFR